MLGTLKYPPNPATPTYTYQLILDTDAAKPNVSETPTIGFPFELTSITFSTDKVSGSAHYLTLLLAQNPWISGDPYQGALLHRITGNNFNPGQDTLVVQRNFPLTLRPRIRVPVAGWRIRVVQGTANSFHEIRVIIVITPLD